MTVSEAGGLDPVIHAPNRLQICALLAPSFEVEFRVIKDHLDVSDSVVSKQIKILEEAGYVKAVKRSEFGRQRTWLSLTGPGRKAYDHHVKALRQIVGGTSGG